MTDGDKSLDSLRQEIDVLDDKIHDLLMRRFAVAEEIARVKQTQEGDRAAIRAGREAIILRRLLARHSGSLSRGVVARIWRELIAAICRMQAPLKVAVCAPEKSVGYWDLARSHYGSGTPMTLHHSPQIVLRMVSEGEAVVGILPAPQQGDEKPWWPHLATSVENAPKIIARLPFIEDLGGRFEDLGAVAVACIEPEASGRDISLVTVMADGEISRTRLREMLDSAGFDGQTVNILTHRSEGGGWLHMVEVDDFVSASDPRLKALKDTASGSIHGILSLGAYALSDDSAKPGHS